MALKDVLAVRPTALRVLMSSRAEVGKVLEGQRGCKLSPETLPV